MDTRWKSFPAMARQNSKRTPNLPLVASGAQVAAADFPDDNSLSGTRTCDQRVKSLLLYSAELQGAKALVDVSCHGSTRIINCGFPGRDAVFTRHNQSKGIVTYEHGTKKDDAD
jgi:hypothetical protein